MQQSQYDYEENGTYCYPGTNVLRNKLNIHEKDILSDAERSISLLRMIEQIQSAVKFRRVLNPHRNSPVLRTHGVLRNPPLFLGGFKTLPEFSFQICN